MCISLFTEAIPVNYTNEFRDLFEVTKHIWEQIYAVS